MIKSLLRSAMRGLLLLGVLFVSTVHATDFPTASNNAYNWLVSQAFPNGLYCSQPQAGNDSYTYDMGVAIAAFVAKNDLTRAHSLLVAMKGLQNTAGYWPNSYAYNSSTNTTTISDNERDVGPTLWVIIGAGCYKQATGSTEFDAMAQKALNWCLTFQQTDGGINGGLSSTGSNLTYASTEENEDAYAALRAFGFTTQAGKVKTFLDTTCWDATNKHWKAGRADSTIFSDVNAWGVASLGSSGPTNYLQALDYNMAHMRLTITSGGISVDGFSFSGSAVTDVWLEGTGQNAEAFYEVGRPTDGDYFTGQIIKFQKADGGVPYSMLGGSTGDGETMTKSEAISSTGFLIFAIERYNPFTRCVSAGPAQAAAPTFSPGGGTYASAQTVTMSTATANAFISYTTDGTTPNSSTDGTVYTSPITIGTTTTLKAMAYETGFTDSGVTTATYTISSGSVTLTSADGFFNAPLSASQNGVFTVQFDASASLSPSNVTIGLSQGSQTAYTGMAVAVRFNPTGFIDARNGGAYGASSIAFTANTTYHFRLVVDVPNHLYSAFVTAPGGSEQTVGSNFAFRTEQAGVTALDTTTIAVNATPGGSATVGPRTIGTTVATPSFSPGGATYNNDQSVLITTSTSGASIRYTLDGSTPTSTTGTLYSGAVPITASATLKAIAYKAGLTDSAVASSTYTLQVATPAFSPAGGTYSTAQSITLTTATSGATIRYTTDGSTPTATTGTIYTGAIAVSSTTTIKAIGVKTGYSDSSIATAAYTFSTGGTTYTAANGFVNVPLSSSQSGTFTAQFDASVSISPSNTTLSLCQGAQTAYTGLACMARFNSTGTIDARNGGAFAAASSIPFSAGVSYHFRFVVNVPAHTYSVFVTPAGGSELTVGSNYAFRTEQAAVTALDNFNVDVNATPGGSVTVSAVTISGPPPTVAFEAENLTRTSSGATTTLQTDSLASGGQWVSLDSTAAGQYVEYTTPSIAAGTYSVQIAYKAYTTRGILNLKVDGTQIGGTVDQYASPSTYTSSTFGNVTFATAGTHVIRLTVTGKNASSTNYILSADKFTLVGQ
jgi:hypothetical protein